MGPLLSSHRRVAPVLEAVRVEERTDGGRSWRGRPRRSRKAMARAFVAKAALNVPTTRDLVERLGIDARLRRVRGFVGRVPGEATFSRAFAALAGSGVLDEAHGSAVRAHLGLEVVHRVSHDSTAIPGRERTPEKPKAPPAAGPGRGGRRARGQRPPPTVREPQEGRPWRESPALLSTACDHGVKIGPKGCPLCWRGHKGHASTADDGIPLAFFTASAGVGDGDVAIPLVKAVAERVGGVFYDLFDAGHQGEPIVRACRGLGHVPIVSPKATRKGEPAIPLPPDRLRRFASRTTVERSHSDPKENHGANRLYVRGRDEVHARLMCGVLAIFGPRVLRL